jgi:hypothetical protein
MHTPLQEEIEAGRAPALQFLRDNGTYYQQVVSSFPTMSVTIDTTMLTGEAPNKHEIYGLTYFHEQQKRLINFGTGPKETFLFGLKQVLRAGMMQLNQQLISKEVSTIHEDTDKHTASINAMIYRGKNNTYLHTPWLTWLFGLLPRKIKTSAPTYFSLGSMHPIDQKSKFGGIWSKFGINDRFSQMEVVSLIKRDELPPLSLIYFPGNDKYLHKKGTQEGKGITKVDQAVGSILDACGSWEEAIQKCNFIVVGDSGQTNMIGKNAYVDMRKVLHSFSIMPLSRKTPLVQDQLVLCVNERMIFIHIQDGQVSYQDVVRACKAEKKLDVIAWHEDGWIHVVSGHTDGALSFRSGGEYLDEYDQQWQLEGDISILDLTMEAHKITYGTYPDALFRLSGAMNPIGRTIIVTVSPGYQLISHGSPKYKGGAHGSLHHLDSLVPMIITGIKSKPDHLRLINFKKWLLTLLEE